MRRTKLLVIACLTALSMTGCSSTPPRAAGVAVTPPPSATPIPTPSASEPSAPAPSPTVQPEATVKQYVNVVTGSIKAMRKTWLPMQNDGCALGIASGCSGIPRTINREAQGLQTAIDHADTAGGAHYIGDTPMEVAQLVITTRSAAKKVDGDVSDTSGKSKEDLYVDMVDLLAAFDEWDPYIDNPAASVGDPAWVPCDPYGEPYADGTCADTDTCDESYSSAQDPDHGLDSFIENPYLYDTKRLRDCPQFLPLWHRSLGGFSEGVEVIPRDAKPGRYVTTSVVDGNGEVQDCYWERERNGHIVANNFLSGASKVIVTIQSGDDAFTTRGCGDWVKIG